MGTRLCRIVLLTVAIASSTVGAASFDIGTPIAFLPETLAEISGMSHSRRNRDVFWMHNDSGDRARVYAVSRQGVLLGAYTLEGASNVDWEDMAIGPAPDGGSYLYLADIGDNLGRRRTVRVYRTLEPDVDTSRTNVRETLTGTVAFTFVYEDGPRDAEAFMVDPITNDFYIVSKWELTGNRLYRASGPSPSSINTLKRVGTFPFQFTTGGDISADGLQVIIRRYSDDSVNPLTPPQLAASYWRRASTNVPLVELLTRPATVVPLVREIQGEAIAFDADGRGFYTTGERGPRRGVRVPINFYSMN
jgi:hypothetical protein